MTMKFLRVMLEPDPAPISPTDSEVSILTASLSGISDGAVAMLDVTLQGLGPNTSRVSIRLVTPGYAPSSGVVDHALVDVSPGEFARVHLSGAAVLSDGAASYEAFVSVEGGSIQVHGVNNLEDALTKLIIFGGFANGA